MPDSSLCRAVLPDCVHFSCCSPIASTSATALRLCPFQLLLPEYVRFSFFPLELLLPDCVYSNCCSLIVSTTIAAPFSCCFLIVSASTTAHRLSPLQLRFPDCNFDCVLFSCCSLIAPQPLPNVVVHLRCIVSMMVVTNLVPPPRTPTSIYHTHTDRRMHTLNLDV